MLDSQIVRSPLLPGGDLISAVLDRDVMMLADRGGGSGMVGQRWADVCAEWTAGWHNRETPVPDGDPELLLVDRVVRLDERPEIARVASKRGLQNPDLLFLGRRGQVDAIQAADAKFSVETARSKQVSPAVVNALLAAEDILQPLLGPLPSGLAVVPGVFLCPDFPLTHIMLRRRQGIVRVTVTEREVVFVPAPASRFFVQMEGSDVMHLLATVDDLPVQPQESLLAGLYYFRLARAAVGCWLDSVKPLLLFNDQVEVDEATVRAETERRVAAASSALDLILRWDADVQTVRSQRMAVEQVAGLPISGKDLRQLIATLSNGRVEEPPSVNQVRRRLGAWYREQLRERVGPLDPPVRDLNAALEAVASSGASLMPELKQLAARVVEELIDQARTEQEERSARAS